MRGVTPIPSGPGSVYHWKLPLLVGVLKSVPVVRALSSVPVVMLEAFV
jgi:hypothetical protein